VFIKLPNDFQLHFILALELVREQLENIFGFVQRSKRLAVL
jgi:hypothetical protein